MIKQLLKKVLIIYLVVIACVFTPTYKAYAVSAGGWAFSSFDVAKSVVTAMKNGSSASVAVAKSPITAKIAKGIVGGAIAGVAIPLAISQISGIALSAVDWVLDPANNAIKYRDKNPPSGYYYAWKEPKRTYYLTAEEAGRAACYWQPETQTFVNVIDTVNSGAMRVACRTRTGSTETAYIAYEGKTPDNTYKTIPIPTVADKIYDNAKTDSNSRSVVNDAVREYVNEGSADVALDAAKADADATHNCGTGTHWSGSACVADTPNTPTTPDVPFDPSSILDAIASLFNAVMSIPDVINAAIDKVLDAISSIIDVINLAIDKVINAIKDIIKPLVDLITSFIDWFKDKFTALYDAITNFFQWVKDTATAWKDDFVDEYKAFRDWVKSEPTPENPTQPDVTTLPTPPTDSVNISFGGGCPAPKVVPWSFAGRNVDITIPYTPICDTATLLNPLIKLAASLGAVFIIAGIRRGDDG